MEELPSRKISNLPARAFLDENNRVRVPQLADVIQRVGHIKVGLDGRLWRYNNGVYSPDGEQFVGASVREFLGDKFSKHWLSEVLAYLKTFTPENMSNPDPHYLNVKNGLLDLTTLEFLPHNPDIVSTVQIPVNWNPEGACPITDKFLKSVIPEDATEIIYEIIGYALYSGTPLRKAVLLLGPGGNGKSVLLRLIDALLGSENVSHVSLQLLSENQFARASLVSKLANICGDLDARSIRHSDIFKQVTGGDRIFAEYKGRDGFSFTSIALLIFSANEAPASSDQTKAWFDRWLIVPMERRFEGTADADPHISSKLTTQPELEGLLFRSVNALHTLLERGEFHIPTSMAKAADGYRENLDTVSTFVEEMCVLGGEDWIRRSDLAAAYRKWCQESGRSVVTVTEFNKRLSSSYNGRVSLATRRGIRGWKGVRLQVESDWKVE